MEVVLGAGITLITLLGTSVLNRVGARADARAKASQEAGEQLAEYVTHIWDKGDESYIKLENFLARLRGPLHRAGVPNALYIDLREKAMEMWRRLEYIGDEIGWSSNTERHDAVVRAVDRIYGVLEAKPAWWRRPFA
jgi:hypothetical protein